jgi:hypothetical protein
MIYIANPIYDAVFKFLLEDEEIAKRFIEIIISREIEQLTLLPQEKVIVKDDLPVRVQRLDFIAQIVEVDGKRSKVLIELQKSNQFYHADVMRFRGYLGKQYIIDNLPIITIYLLGFVLDERLPASVWASREYINLSTKDKIPYKNEFIEKLSHDCYVIQIPLLKKPLRTKIDYLLSIFDQNQVMSQDTEGKKVLAYPEEEIKDKDLEKVIKRLQLANADEKLREKMEDEEYLERAYQETIGKLEAEMVELKDTIEEKDKALEEKDKTIEETHKALEQEKQRAEQLEQEKVFIIKELLSEGIAKDKVMKITGTDEAFFKKHNIL